MPNKKGTSGKKMAEINKTINAFFGFQIGEDGKQTKETLLCHFILIKLTKRKKKKDTRIARANSKGGKKAAFQSNAVSTDYNTSGGATWLIYLGV